MNFKVIATTAIIAGLSLLIAAGCDSKGKEALENARKARQEAESQLQRLEERDRQAQDIIQKKFDAVARTDSRFKDYASSGDDDDSSQEEPGDEDGTLIGAVLVWGVKPGTVGSTEGFTIALISDDGSYYSEIVDSKNRYTISAPPGEYMLTIDAPGYEHFEKRVKVESGRTRMVSPIGLKNQ